MFLVCSWTYQEFTQVATWLMIHIDRLMLQVDVEQLDSRKNYKYIDIHTKCIYTKL